MGGKYIAGCALAAFLSISASGQEVASDTGVSSATGEFDPDLGSDAPLITGFLGELKLDLQDWIRKRDEAAIPIGPEEASNLLDDLARDYAKQCKDDGSPQCLRAEGFSRAAQRLEAAAADSPGCDHAARLFRDRYRAADPPAAVANAFDLACLGSFTPRLDADGAAVEAVRPPLLADAQPFAGITSAVGFLELDGSIGCAGLLRPEGRFLTARHCVTPAGNGRYRVISAGGAILGSALKVSAQAPGDQIGVSADWAIFDLPGPVAAQVARTNLIPLEGPTEVTFVAVYPHAGHTSYQREDPLPWQAMRFPRAGMCHALVAYKGCVQLVCQTVRGFSGAPVFSGRNADGSFDVIGFIGKSDGLDVGCSGTENVTNSTFAVAAEVFDR